MLSVEIPGRGLLTITHVVFDMNGTLAAGGQILSEIWPRFGEVRDRFSCLVLTGDTFGTAGEARAVLGCEVRVVARGEDKAETVRQLGDAVAAVGNGRNDVRMFQAARLAIAVLGPEGLAREAMMAADIVAPDIGAALGLLVSEKVLAAALRA